MIKTFRGLMASDTQDTIVLHTNDGSTGYRIVKFQIFPNNFNVTDEYNIKIYKISQATNTTTYNFADNTLIAAAYFENGSGVGSEGSYHNTAIFDNEIFNQDIYVSAISQSGASCNYYIELEQIKLDISESTVATLKNIRAERPTTEG